MSRRARFTIVTLLLLLGPALREATACSCAGPSGCGADDAAALFVGKVIDVRDGADEQIARFKVERAVRGAQVGGIVAVRSVPYSRSDCGVSFRPGDRYLVSAHHTLEPAGRSVSGFDTPYGTSACEGNRRIDDGDPGPVFPLRSDIGGRITRFEPGGRWDSSDRPRVVGVRVWVRTRAGVIETRTDKDGDFLLRNVPLNPATPLQVDLPAGEKIRRTVLGVWTPEACRLLDVIVEKLRAR